MENKYDKCFYCGNEGYIKYMYLGLENKVKNWFRSKIMCIKMLVYWNEKEYWLENVESWYLKKEIWDGNRWLEFQWFWNLESVWILLIFCLYCDIFIFVDYVINLLDRDGGGVFKIVECFVCFENFEYCVKVVKGFLLNLVFIGYFDGWQLFGISYRGLGFFEVIIVNMKKSERNYVDEVYVVGFVLCFEVLNLFELLDFFLQFFMNDLCNGFI